ncbi:MAG TPA: hypothetical protein VGG16_06805, partial [Streptosporangiaceae bacterium]
MRARARVGVVAGAAALCTAAALVAGGAVAGASPSAGAHTARTQGSGFGYTPLIPGNLLVSGSQYVPDRNLVAGQTQLPPGCTTGCVTANASGGYPQVFNNVLLDPNFGVTSPVFLQEISPSGFPLGQINVPTNDLVTSFSSKSELALNLSPDGRYVSFVGYVAKPDTIDVSNANTPGVIDPTNPVTGAYYRTVAQLSGSGRFQFTDTNAYSGDNGRAAVTADVTGQELIYSTGNAGNGSNPQPAGVIAGTGAQL